MRSNAYQPIVHITCKCASKRDTGHTGTGILIQHACIRTTTERERERERQRELERAREKDRERERELPSDGLLSLKLGLPRRRRRLGDRTEFAEKRPSG